MRDESIAAPDIENFRSSWNYARDLQSHVVSAADLAPAPFADPATLQTRHKSLARSCLLGD
jgi:hypothetical protein